MTEGASMTGVRTEGTAGPMVQVLSKKRGAAASGTVAVLITVGFYLVSHLCIASKFARNIRAGLSCARMVIHMRSTKGLLHNVIQRLSVAMQQALTTRHMICGVFGILARLVIFLADGCTFSISKLCSHDALYCAKFYLQVLQCSLCLLV